MATTTVATTQQNNLTNQILHGDCIQVMCQIPANSVDFILTDPPYLVKYRDRSARTIQSADWIFLGALDVNPVP
jgi:DNA modification methylase